MITRYLLKRFSIAVAILLVMSSALFCASRVEDPRSVLLNEYTTHEQWEAWGEELGLNRPQVVQYGVWIVDSMRIDFGTSRERRTSARPIAFEYARLTLRLLAGGFAFAVLFSAAAMLAINYVGERGPLPEQIGSWARVIVPAIPPFIPAVLLAHIFHFNSLLFPPFREGVWGYVLPFATLGIVIAYAVVRLFVAAGKDAANSAIMPGHLTPAGKVRGSAIPRAIAKNMLVNLLRSSRFYLPVLLAAVIFTELIFDMRGLSNFIFGISLFQDLPLVSSALMLLTLAYVSAVLLMDVARAFVDPQVRGGSADASLTGSAVVSGLRPMSPGEWPLFGRRPMVAVTALGLIILLSVCVPVVVSYRGDAVGTDWLYRIFLSTRQALTIFTMALIAAAIAGTVAALAANRFGGVIDQTLVWLFDLLTTLPILILGIAGFLVWLYSFTFWFLSPLTPVFVQSLTYPASLFAIIISGMFFHQVRTDARESHAQQGAFERYVVSGVLKVAVVSAGPLILLGATFDAAGGWAAGWAGWGGPTNRVGFTLTSIWWTLLAGLVLILTILCLNFLGTWLRERLDTHPSQQEAGPAQDPV